MAVRDEVERAGADPASVNRSSAESALVAGAKTENATGLDELFKRYERSIFRITHRITRNHEDAKDVVQQLFHWAFLYLKSFLGDSMFGTWLTHIAVNEALMLIRCMVPSVIAYHQAVRLPTSPLS